MFSVTRLQTSVEEATNHRHQWPLQFDATESDDVNVPAPIFVMQDNVAELIGPQFSCVASAIQMEDLPVDAPNSSGPFYRVASFKVLTRSADAATEFEDKVFAAIQDLADNIASANRLSDEITVVITPEVI